MTEIIRAKNSTNQTEPLGENWEKVVFPDTLSSKEQLKLYPSVVNSLSQKVQGLDTDISDMKQELVANREKLGEQSNKNIEILGIFSAILALLIIDVSIIKSVDTFLSAILLICALTFSIIIFISLVHHFFGKQDSKTFGKSFWIPMILLGLLLLLGIFTYVKNINLNQIQTPTSNSNLAKPNP